MWMNTRVRSLVVGMCALLAAVAASAMEQRPLVLRHLTTADGLPQATVMTTLRDSQGFVWLGTEDGLVRFDGRQVVRYARSPDARDSLPGNFIWQVVEDAHHDLWIAIKNAGVARWRRDTDRFESYQHVADDADSLASNSVHTLLVDRQGRVWVGTTDAGVDILDPSSGHVRHLRHDPLQKDSLSSDYVYTLTQDRAGDVWIGTKEGLDRWQHDGDRIMRIGTDRPKSILRAEISRVLEASDGTYWVGSYVKGLAQIDATGRVLRQERHQPGKPATLADNDVRALLQDAAGNLWVGTADGLSLLEPGARSFQRYQHEAGDATTLRDSMVMSLYQDPTGLVWIGTRSGGVSRWDPRSWQMGGARPRWLREQMVMAFADAPGRSVWIASLAGLFRYDTQTGTATPIDSVVHRANALGDRRVMSLHADRGGSLWIGTMFEGLKRLRPDNTLQSIPIPKDKPRATSATGILESRTTSAAGIMSIAEARSGQIWVGTFGAGANIVDPQTGGIRQLPFDGGQGALSGADVTAILEDAQGRFWLGTAGNGLNLADAQGRVLRVFRHDPADPHGLPSDVIYSLTLGSDGQVWAGTDAGVARTVAASARTDALQFKTVSLARGQGSDVAYGLIADSQGGMWISGNAGLVHLEPATGATRVYHREDGLQGEEFSNGAVQRLRDGRLAFGGPGGFNIFDPTHLSGSREPPSLQLTSADVLGVPVEGAAPMWARPGLSLGYRASIVSLDFAVLDFAAPEHSRLSYRLTGLTDRWIDLGAQRRITLTNLPAGDHMLEVRAASADSPWSSTPLRFALHRDPAPWRTLWAYALYALLAGLLVAARIRHQRRKFRDMERARDHLESQVRDRTSELVESNRQLEEAARAKSDFLDRMSHELRTPMNGVVGMTELLSRTSLTATQGHLTKTIRASAQILLQIVNDLLDLSKIRAGKVALETLPVDLGQVLEECTSLFAGAAEAKGLELIVCPPAMRRSLRGDPLRVRQILMNLVGNAVKFTSQGEIVVRADVEQIDTTRVAVRLSVTDTGIGIDPAVLAKIFEPFTQADEKTTRQFGGTGLGLAICRELADLMGGRISVESRQQIGSTFCLHLPMEAGDELPQEPRLPRASARLYTRRPAFAESLQRHCAMLGLTLTWDAAGQQQDPPADDLLLIDVSTHESLLTRLLAQPRRASLVAIATPADAERLGLRLLLPERAVVLKPVHHMAVREALATVMNVPQLAGSSAPSPQTLQRLQGHVLLVEDDAVNAAVAEGYLAELGCTAAWVTSAEAAIARSQAEHFDLVFMDLNMSDMDGFAATARIREREAPGARIPIVALTAHDAHSYRERVLRAGMDDILSKPYSLDDCRAMLARWLPGKPGSAAANKVAEQRGADALAAIDEGSVRAVGKLGAGSSALYERLTTLFEKSSQPLMVRLNAALQARDLKQAADVCHTLKSSAANVGARAFSDKVRELEQLCREEESERAIALHARLAAAYEPLLDGLRSTRMKASA